jgi:DNA modification methylase
MKGVIIAGHGMYQAALQEGYTHVPVEYCALDEKLSKAYLVADNETARKAVTEQDQLSNLLQEISEIPDFDIEATGFSLGDLDSLLESNVSGEVEEDKFDLDQEVPQKCQNGDLWILGKHRLLCGDSTKRNDVERLMNGKKANLLFTSPPYWVGMEYETQKSEAEITDFIKNVVYSWTDSISVDLGRIIINTGTAAIHRIEKKRKVEVLPLIDKWQAFLKQRGWLARHFRIWAKSGDLPASISPKTDVVDQHWEHLTLFEHQDTEYSYIGTFWSPAGEQRGQEKIGTSWAQQGVWTDIQGDRSAGGKHCAAFPVELPARNMRLYSKEGEICAEPFGGAGTSIIAAEQLNRICYAMELDPHYCDVILQRWEQFTGQTAERIE